MQGLEIHESSALHTLHALKISLTSTPITVVETLRMTMEAVPKSSRTDLVRLTVSASTTTPRHVTSTKICCVQERNCTSVRKIPAVEHCSPEHNLVTLQRVIRALWSPPARAFSALHMSPLTQAEWECCNRSYPQSHH